MLVKLLCLATLLHLDICSQPLLTGPCRALFHRFGYDPKKADCVQFIYGGCSGNENNFETKEACQKRCVKKASSP